MSSNMPQSNNKYLAQWSPHHFDTFVVGSGTDLRLCKALLQPTPVQPWTAGTFNGACGKRTFQALGVCSGISEPLQCVDWNKDTNHPYMVCAGTASTGCLLFVNFDSRLTRDSVNAPGCIKLQIKQTSKRRCNAVAWNPIIQNRIAAGFESNRSHKPTLVYDINYASSDTNTLQTSSSSSSSSRRPKSLSTTSAGYTSSDSGLKYTGNGDTSIGGDGAARGSVPNFQDEPSYGVLCAVGGGSDATTSLSWVPDNANLLMVGTSKNFLRCYDLRINNNSSAISAASKSSTNFSTSSSALGANNSPNLSPDSPYSLHSVVSVRPHSEGSVLGINFDPWNASRFVTFTESLIEKKPRVRVWDLRRMDSSSALSSHIIEPAPFDIECAAGSKGRIVSVDWSNVRPGQLSLISNDEPCVYLYEVGGSGGYRSIVDNDTMGSSNVSPSASGTSSPRRASAPIITMEDNATGSFQQQQQQLAIQHQSIQQALLKPASPALPQVDEEQVGLIDDMSEDMMRWGTGKNAGKYPSNTSGKLSALDKRSLHRRYHTSSDTSLPIHDSGPVSTRSSTHWSQKHNIDDEKNDFTNTLNSPINSMSTSSEMQNSPKTTPAWMSSASFIRPSIKVNSKRWCGGLVVNAVWKPVETSFGFCHSVPEFNDVSHADVMQTDLNNENEEAGGYELHVALQCVGKGTGNGSFSGEIKNQSFKQAVRIDKPLSILRTDIGGIENRMLLFLEKGRVEDVSIRPPIPISFSNTSQLAFVGARASGSGAFVFSEGLSNWESGPNMKLRAFRGYSVDYDVNRQVLMKIKEEVLLRGEHSVPGYNTDAALKTLENAMCFWNWIKRATELDRADLSKLGVCTILEPQGMDDSENDDSYIVTTKLQAGLVIRASARRACCLKLCGWEHQHWDENNYATADNDVLLTYEREAMLAILQGEMESAVDKLDIAADELIMRAQHWDFAVQQRQQQHDEELQQQGEQESENGEDSERGEEEQEQQEQQEQQEEAAMAARNNAELLGLVSLTFSGFPEKKQSQLWKEAAERLLQRLGDFPYLELACSFLLSLHDNNPTIEQQQTRRRRHHTNAQQHSANTIGSRQTSNIRSISNNKHQNDEESNEDEWQYNTLQWVFSSPSLTLVDRIAFACLYLSDTQLSAYVEKLKEEAMRNGSLVGIVLTGLSLDGMALLQMYIDNTGDVQTAALGALSVAPQVHAGGGMPDQWHLRMCKWLDSYRTLLNAWQLWEERATLDVEIGALERIQRTKKSKDAESKSGSGGGGTSVEFASTGNGSIEELSPVALARAKAYEAARALRRNKVHFVVSCVTCYQSLQAKSLVQLKGSDQSLRDASALLQQCPACTKECLPACCICLMPVKSVNPYVQSVQRSRGVGRGGGGGGVAADRVVGDTLARQGFGRWVSLCLGCRHGGHAACLVDWFDKHNQCAVSDCKCDCNA